MKGNDWNVIKIITDILHNKFSIKFTTMMSTIGCKEETFRRWRNGATKKIQDDNIDLIYKNLPKVLRTEEDKQQYMILVKDAFENAGSKVGVRLEQITTLEELLEYLCKDFKQDLGKDKIYELTNGLKADSQLREIILEKFRINEKRTPIFRVKKLGVEEKTEIENKPMKWKLDLEHCFVLEFKEKEKSYTYKVLVNYNFNKKAHKDAGEYAEARDAVKAYGVKMILLFSNTKISDQEMRFFMDSNIYVEQISSKELVEKMISKDYVYSSSSLDMEIEILANKYADIILGRINKYYSVIFKNILFESEKSLGNKYIDNFIFWEAKFATRHHINFQTNRIMELLNAREDMTTRKALAIGYLSFPSILRLIHKFDKVYLMDNSSKSLKMYENYLQENCSVLLSKVEFVTFTSVMFDAIVKHYNLYNTFDFVLLGTGSASFLKKIQPYYMMSNLWLKRNGVLYVSFINSEFLYEYVDRVTAEENFEFIPSTGGGRATALMNNSTEKFELYCETGSYSALKESAEKYFSVEKGYSYPLASVLQGTYKKPLQNILKELDKEYSKKGIEQKTFSNCKGYYVDMVLRKGNGEKIEMSKLENDSIKRVVFDSDNKYKKFYLKTLLLEEIHLSKEKEENDENLQEIYVVTLPSQKMLPETDCNEICLGEKRFSLMSISEINKLGIEYKNISPFLSKKCSSIKLTKVYDSEIHRKEVPFYYVGDGSFDGGYKIEKEKLLKLLKDFHYTEINI